MENTDLIDDKINTRLGIAFLRATEAKTEITDVFLKIKGVDKIEELTRKELKQLEHYVKSFAAALAEHKQPGDVMVKFTFRGKQINLGKLSNLDLTIEVLQLIDSFAPDNFDKISVFLACLFAPLVKAATNSSDHIGKIADELDEVILNDMPFADAVSLYFFFRNLKEIFSTVSEKSFKTYIKLYQFKMKTSIFSTLIYQRRVVSSLNRYSKPLIILLNIKFLIKTIFAAIRLLNCVIIELLADWWRSTFHAMQRISSKIKINK